jgi:hypothetical protein
MEVVVKLALFFSCNQSWVKNQPILGAKNQPNLQDSARFSRILKNSITEDSTVEDSVRFSRFLGQESTDSRESEPRDLGESEPWESGQVNQTK